MPMPPSPYTSIEVLLDIFESYMHNCTTTSIEALLSMSKYFIYKQAIHLFLLQNVELPASRWFGLSTGRRSGDGSKLWTSVFRSVCGNHGWDCEKVQWWESWVRFFIWEKWVRLSPSPSSVFAIVILAVINIVDIFLICQSHSNHVSNQETWWWEPPSAGQVLLFLFFRSLKRSSFELDWPKIEFFFFIGV